MARREFTSGQKRIVDRYYQHLDSITLAKLGEIVSELAMADGKAVDRLWKRAETHLAKTGANDARIRTILETRSVEALARLLTELR
ncbi:MAG: hypothetical protein KF817_11815 [Phycisphaeraceae bacterium]|nr:hypothetical protein [Phycisphaeraceae bacterium]